MNTVFITLTSASVGRTEQAFGNLYTSSWAYRLRESLLFDGEYTVACKIHVHLPWIEISLLFASRTSQAIPTLHVNISRYHMALARKIQQYAVQTTSSVPTVISLENEYMVAGNLLNMSPTRCFQLKSLPGDNPAH